MDKIELSYIDKRSGMQMHGKNIEGIFGMFYEILAFFVDVPTFDVESLDIVDDHIVSDCGVSMELVKCESTLELFDRYYDNNEKIKRIELPCNLAYLVTGKIFFDNKEYFIEIDHDKIHQEIDSFNGTSITNCRKCDNLTTNFTCEYFCDSCGKNKNYSYVGDYDDEGCCCQELYIIPDGFDKLNVKCCECLRDLRHKERKIYYVLKCNNCN